MKITLYIYNSILIIIGCFLIGKAFNNFNLGFGIYFILLAFLKEG
jgi:hypothetical protein